MIEAVVIVLATVGFIYAGMLSALREPKEKKSRAKPAR